MTAKLWCVHVQGPDSLIAQPDRETADKRAAEWQAGFDAMLARDPSPNDPVLKAVVIEWPYTSRAHAECVAIHGGAPEDLF